MALKGVNVGDTYYQKAPYLHPHQLRNTKSIDAQIRDQYDARRIPGQKESSEKIVEKPVS
jgi:hypothetical protein